MPLEPFPTFYLRSARAYAFLGNVLHAALGDAALQSTGRMREDGTASKTTLATELAIKTKWLYGLHLVAAASIGMRDELTEDERAANDVAELEESARSWLAAWRDDPEIAIDPRVAVPMVRDDLHGITRNLAVVGVKLIRISASYLEGYEPEVEQDAKSAQFCTVRDFVAWEPYMLVEQSLEFERRIDLPPLDRDALRDRLDGLTKLDEMRRALEAP